MQGTKRDFEVAKHLYTIDNERGALEVVDRILGFDGCSNAETRLEVLAAWLEAPLRAPQPSVSHDGEGQMTIAFENPHQPMFAFGVAGLVDLMALRSRAFSAILFGSCPSAVKEQVLPGALENAGFVAALFGPWIEEDRFPGGALADTFRETVPALYTIAAQPCVLHSGYIAKGLTMMEKSLTLLPNQPNTLALMTMTVPRILSQLEPEHPAQAIAQRLNTRLASPAPRRAERTASMTREEAEELRAIHGSRGVVRWIATLAGAVVVIVWIVLLSAWARR